MDCWRLIVGLLGLLLLLVLVLICYNLLYCDKLCCLLLRCLTVVEPLNRNWSKERLVSLSPVHDSRWLLT